MKARHLFHWTLLIAVDVVAQVAFKVAGSGLDSSGGLLALLMQGLHSPWVALALALYLATFSVWMLILREGDLSRQFPMTAITSAAAVAAGVAVFNESISASGLLAIGLIIAGVTMLARS